ncbi:MAG TPA: NAD(P)-binding domain-containing protein [Candidatus Saccharimonadia bacterium]|nr:NAD(P)-binding domain-containing protein [Candidatus Saccharimonadia bacterium]
MPSRPPIRYLDAAQVEAAMPSVEERIRLAEVTMKALAGDAQLPPKLGVEPRPTDAFAHAMPAFLPGSDPTGADDLLGMKWVVGFPGNGAIGLPTISALVLLDDPRNGFPIGILDGTPITAQRTAAVSGVAIRHFAPRVVGRPMRAALIGSGVQGRSHLPVLGHLLPGLTLAVHDRHPERAASLAELARGTAGIAEVEAAPSAEAAMAGADVVVTAVSFGAVRQVAPSDWLARDALVVAVDYATMISAAVAREAALFLVDDRGQFAASRASGAFADYPDPAATIGEAILAGGERPAEGRVLVSHLGVGLADVIFGNAILAAATAAGTGVLLQAG